MNQITAYISVGSNLGDRIENCESGIVQLVAGGNVTLLERSDYYFTEPVGYADQPWFVNAVFSILTDLSPVSLLMRLKAIEAICGRTEGGIRFGPRVLDLDIILYDGITMDTPELTVPHPRMHERLFVLRPLSDIAPNLVHPGLGITVSQILSGLPVDSKQCRPAPQG